MSRRSRRALARSARAERSLLALLGIVLLALGVFGALVGFGVFGDGRSSRPVVDPLAVGFLHDNALVASVAAIVLGVVLVVLGLTWVARTLRPERRPDLVLSSGEASSLRVTAGAAASAVKDDAERLDGVTRASARLVGRPSAPALRMTLWLTDGADVRTVWRDLEESVLSRVRSSLGISSLPTAIRLELDRVASRSRVS
ncbi:hypothetical protein [Pseudonocardia spinosispora]|uniref:hypothetical protein n=1 Tax=Pseudonocardia spinosispora TaxID=103441 RepID=UPI00040740F1|nr:hypothetical protein [Pseudonocardia spinosispora]